MADPANIYSPKEAADHIGVTSQSIRRYCDRFARFLSPGASPQPGAVRHLTPEDVYILQQVYTLTQAGLTYDDIEERLETLTLPDIVELEPEEEMLPALPEGLAVLQQLTETLQGVQQALTMLSEHQADTSALHQRLDALRDAQAAQEGQQAHQQARLQAQLEQIAENQRQIARATARPLFWAIVGAFISALVVLAAVALALAMGWIG